MRHFDGRRPFFKYLWVLSWRAGGAVGGSRVTEHYLDPGSWAV